MELRCEDFMTGQYNSEESEKFHLITIGQALHFFDKRPFLEKVSSLLARDGVFAV